MNRLLFVKFIVFLLTFLLFFGSLLLVGKIYQNTKSHHVSEIHLQQPDGSSIKQISNDDKNLYILISGGQQPERIVIFNTDHGKITSNLFLN